MSELEKALQLLESLVRQRAAPSHYVARLLLLTLGAALRAEPAAAAAGVERTRRAGEALGEPWAEALRTELGLACGEFAQCVDPRYLDLPGYDLEYTRAARARLEDRLRAATALGFALEDRHREMLELADRVLEARKGAPERPGP
ncbi:MAG TPA: hypothetical protein VF530_12795 [Planctomycetota bacterium]